MIVDHTEPTKANYTLFQKYISSVLRPAHRVSSVQVMAQTNVRTNMLTSQ